MILMLKNLEINF